MVMVERQTYTILEVAKLLGVSDETVRRMIRDGQLTAVKIRNTWRIDKAEVERILGRKL